jgi:signal transduction histidine kinase
VRHRAGSLGAAVARIRRRNLAISGGILLLLLASAGMLMQLAHRAGRLAQQQMEFVAGVSHELRTPLAVIGSAAANLSDGVVREPAQVARYGELIASEGRRLNAMVEQILEFASLQYRRQPVQIQRVAVAPVIREAVQAAEPALLAAGMRLECACRDEAPAVQADPAALRRCLDNLIGNAAKYASEAGWIGIRTECDGQEVRIIVEDRGPGIEARDVPHLFEPFYRGRMAHERQIHGNGLGLALVQRLMQAQGGAVTVQTRAGHGASFTLHLPLTAV